MEKPEFSEKRRKQNLEVYKRVSKKVREILENINSATEKLELKKIVVSPTAWNDQGASRVEIEPKFEYSSI